MAMDGPYFADDTDGVHFEVDVDGARVWAHVARRVLMKRYAIAADCRDWIAVYHAHRDEIDRCVIRRVRQDGQEVVIVGLTDLLANGAAR